MLIAGLSLCMPENGTREIPQSQVTIVRSMDGDKVTIIVGEITVDKLIAQLSCPELGQVVHTPSLLCQDQTLSPDHIISAGSEVRMVINNEYKQVTLSTWGGEKTVTFYGNLNINELNIGSLSFKTLKQYIDYIEDKEGDISVENLFLNTQDIHIDAEARFDMLNGLNITQIKFDGVTFGYIDNLWRVSHHEPESKSVFARGVFTYESVIDLVVEISESRDWRGR